MQWKSNNIRCIQLLLKWIPGQLQGQWAVICFSLAFGLRSASAIPPYKTKCLVDWTSIDSFFGLRNSGRFDFVGIKQFTHWKWKQIVKIIFHYQCHFGWAAFAVVSVRNAVIRKAITGQENSQKMSNNFLALLCQCKIHWILAICHQPERTVHEFDQSFLIRA